MKRINFYKQQFVSDNPVLSFLTMEHPTFIYLFTLIWPQKDLGDFSDLPAKWSSITEEVSLLLTFYEQTESYCFKELITQFRKKGQKPNNM